MALNVMLWPPPFHVSRTRRFRCWAANGQCERDYYEILGVPPDASTQNIRKAYRKLQKQHHPDISGSKGHSMTLMLNEAYQTLSDDKLRAKYNATFPHLAEVKLKQHSSFTGSMYSTWNGPDRPQGVFVDENSCIGCRQCAFVASNTFLFDEPTARARVKTQWADSDETIKVAIQTCPVNCIHYVDRSDLHILEYLMCPRLKPSNGVFGGGWEKPSNIFMAAKDFKRQQEKLKEQHNTTNTSSEGETAAQRRARMDAELKVHFGPLWSLFTWMNSYNNSRKTSGKTGKHRPLFGKSCSSEVFNCVIPLEDMSKTVERLKDWAVTFASSSELPLPMPFQVDFLNNGVKLKLVSAGDGVLTTVGSLYINVEVVEDENTGDVRAKQGIYENVGVKEGIRGKECFVCISRDGVTNTGPLPGERRIVKLVEKLLKGDTAYSSYSIPRNVKQS